MTSSVSNIQIFMVGHKLSLIALVPVYNHDSVTRDKNEEMLLIIFTLSPRQWWVSAWTETVRYLRLLAFIECFVSLFIFEM